ncbi:MAG TPA: hypothetical protein VN258_16775 [Mobilitalea sp.]|nr:hypothetical protein [Mobilitalea sp.]
MNLKSSYYFQINEYKMPVLIYYLVIVSAYTFFLFSNIEMVNSHPGSSASLNGMNIATAVFLFISSLTAFKDNLGMMLQNGVSRKTLFLGRLLTMTTLALLLSIVEDILLIIFQLSVSAFTQNLSINNAFCNYYSNSYYQHIDSFSHLSMFLLLNLAMFLFFMAAGYLFALIFHRLNKAVNIALCIGIPVVCFIILPLLNNRMNGAIGKCLLNFFAYTLGGKWNAFFSFTIAALLLSALTWLPLRRVRVK